MTNKSNEHINKLGLKGKDIVTGFSGVITLVSFDLYGCVQFVLTPPVDKNGNPVEGRWFDVPRIEMKSKKPVISVPKMNDETLGNLGFKAKDTVTGMIGVVSSLGYNLYGYTQFTLTPKVDDNGKSVEGGWFDISRMKLISTKSIMKAPDFVQGYIADALKGPAEKTLPEG